MKPSNICTKILTPVGYAWGVAAAISGTALFMFSGNMDHALAQQSFMRVHPVYSGGEIVRTDSDDATEWRIHRPVFDGLISETKHGFIQIDVICKNRGTIPSNHEIDYDGDGTADFELSIPPHSNAAPVIAKMSPEVTGMERWAETREGWIIRVGLKNRRL